MTKGGFGFLIAALALLSGALWLAGCGGGSGGGEDSGQNFPPSVVGRWRVASVSLGDSTLACPGTLTTPNASLACGATDTYVFAEDFRSGSRSAGTFRLETQEVRPPSVSDGTSNTIVLAESSRTATGRYTLENGRLTLTFDAPVIAPVRDGTSNTIFVGETTPGLRGGAFSLTLSNDEAALSAEGVPIPRRERWTRL